MIIFGMVALNEIDYIDDVIKSVKPYCDKIMVIESCARKPFDYLYKEGFVTKEGLSTDGTTRYLQKRKDITYIPMGMLEGTVEGCAIPKFHEFAKVGDYIWIGTGNEVYFKDKAQLIASMETPYVNISFVTLWQDLKHAIVGKGWSQSFCRVYQYTGEVIINNIYTHDFPVTRLEEEYCSDKYVIEKAARKLAYARKTERVFYKIALQEIEYNDRLNRPGNYRDLRDYITRTNCWFNNFYDDGIEVIKS